MELIIAQTVNNFNLFKKLLSKKTDILAFNHSVMIALDQRNIVYKVAEDFYPTNMYSLDIISYHKKLRQLLNDLDVASKKVTNFPFSYSANELYFLGWLDNLFYLEKLIKIIGSKYKKIYLYSAIEPEQISFNKINYSVFNSHKINGTISFPAENSDQRKIQLIYNALKITYLRDKVISKKNLLLKYKIINYFYRFNSYFNEFKFKMKFYNYNKYKNINKTVYVINNFGYELKRLKKYLPNFQYINPTTKLRQQIEYETPVNLSNISINNILDSFCDANFFYLKKYFQEFINSYHLEIVGRINSFISMFKDCIHKDKPFIFLFSMGTRDVFDTICSYLANKHKIPVLIFQHGGTSSFDDASYNKSIESNLRVFKTLISQAKKDNKKLSNDFTKVLCMGSITYYENNQLQNNKKKSKKILFSLGPSKDTNFRNFFSVNKKHKQSVEIISAAESELLKIDVKLHPIGEIGSFENYTSIIKNARYKYAKIIYGIPIEQISKNYGLIIIDYLCTATLKNFICLKVPIIIYDINLENMRVDKLVFSDICKRFYLAKNRDELLILLKKFKSGGLKSKWSEKIIDSYVYPFKKGNPGVNIAQYIKNLSLYKNNV